MGLNGFRLDLVIAEIVHLDGVEVVAALHDGQVLGPIVRHPLELDPAPDHKLADAVWPGAQRRLHRRAGDVALRPVVLGDDGHHPEAARHDGVAVRGGDDVEAHLARSHDRHRVDDTQGRADGRPGINAISVEAEHHVIHGHGRTVMPAWPVAQLELHPGEVRRPGDAFRQQSVGGGRLVHGHVHERVVDVVSPARPELHAAHHPPAQRRFVEVVPVAHLRHPDHAALGRLGIHVVELGKVGGILGFGEKGVAMPVLDREHGTAKRQQRHQSDGHPSPSHASYMERSAGVAMR